MNMRNRLARRLCAANNYDWVEGFADNWLNQVDEILDELKNPTPEMIDAGSRAKAAVAYGMPSALTLREYASQGYMEKDKLGIPEAHRAMLDAVGQG